RGKHTTIRIDASKQQRRDLAVSENAVEVRIGESAEADLVDDDVRRLRIEIVNNLSTVAAALQDRTAAIRPHPPVAQALTDPHPGSNHRRRQVRQIRAIAPVQPDNRDARTTKGRQQALECRYWAPHRPKIVTAGIEPSA